jgi:hypothetical protein
VSAVQRSKWGLMSVLQHVHVAAVCTKVAVLQLEVLHSGACLFSPLQRFLLKQGCLLPL